MFRPDLHSHTTLSDGTLTPARLVQRALDQGITHLAITDHDCMDGLAEARQAAAGQPLTLIPGTEISTRWVSGRTTREIHIVGLLQDADHPRLKSLLHHHQSLRRQRVAELARQLARRGITGACAYLDGLDCTSPGRNHIADFLISRSHASNKQDAFKRYLGQQGQLSTPAPWCDIGTAVESIRAAGGITVLAHPDRYRLGRRQLRHLLDEFVDRGGEAMEVSYSNLNPDVLRHLASMAGERDLWASAGSDFHTPETTWMELGRIRRLPPGCEGRAVWDHPAWRRFTAA